jgi:hypothetical protein
MLRCRRRKSSQWFREAMNAIATMEKVTKRLEGVRVPQLAMIGGLFAEQEDRELADAVAF